MPNKPLNYRLSNLAEADLLAAFMFGIESFGLEQAQHYAEKIDNTLNSLAKFPDMGNDCNHLFPNAQRFSIGRHTIYYRKTNGSIEIARVLHQSMDERPHFQ